jgi:hypothetical protein
MVLFSESSAPTEISGFGSPNRESQLLILGMGLSKSVSGSSAARAVFVHRQGVVSKASIANATKSTTPRIGCGLG